MIENNRLQLEYCRNISSPIGNVELLSTEEFITSVAIVPMRKPDSATEPHCLLLCQQQLREYFEGRRTSFDLHLLLQGTPFQLRVWKALQTIPYGSTISYKALAELAGRPKAIRAVGGANGRNPICIIIPCHRVINSNGKLGGYSSGNGSETKRWLLAHETQYR